MPKKRYTAAQILATLRQVDGAVAQGQPIAGRPDSAKRGRLRDGRPQRHLKPAQ